MIGKGGIDFDRVDFALPVGSAGRRRVLCELFECVNVVVTVLIVVIVLMMTASVSRLEYPNSRRG